MTDTTASESWELYTSDDGRYWALSEFGMPEDYARELLERVRPLHPHVRLVSYERTCTITTRTYTRENQS